MSKREWELYIEDILECIRKIEIYIEDISLEDFKKDIKTIDAVIRNFEIIGEASKNIPNEIKNKYDDIPWRDIVDFRNRITHEYFGISLTIAWRIVKHELPRLKEQMSAILKKE